MLRQDFDRREAFDPRQDFDSCLKLRSHQDFATRQYYHFILKTDSDLMLPRIIEQAWNRMNVRLTFSTHICSN